MKAENDPQYLLFEHEGYACYKLPVNNQTNARALHLRGLHKERLHNAGYDGYSEEFDEIMHRSGIYLYVVWEGIIATTMRINDRISSELFPFEMGYKPDGTRHVYKNNTPAIDMNTYCLDKRCYRKATPLLFAMAAKHIQENGFQRAFGLADTQNKAIQKLYSRIGLVHSSEYREPVAFETFVYRDGGKPVEWNILEWPMPEIKRFSDLFDERKLAYLN